VLEGGHGGSLYACWFIANYGDGRMLRPGHTVRRLNALLYLLAILLLAARTF